MEETRNWKEPCQHASCRLGDEEEVKEERERRRGEKRWVEVERSGSSDHTSCIQEPVSAESISSDSAMFSLAHYVLFALQLSSLYFFPFYLTIPLGWLLVRYFLQYVFLQFVSALSYNTQGAMNQLWSIWGLGPIAEQRGFFLVTKPTTECSISPCPCNYPLFSDTLLILISTFNY